jgi:prevent-host-death family protein
MKPQFQTIIFDFDYTLADSSRGVVECINSATEIKAHLSSYAKESEKGPIIVTKNVKPVAVLLGLTDLEEIERLILAYSPKF